MQNTYTISVFSENNVGLLYKIAMVFSRRRINIERLSVFPSNHEGVHKFIIVIREQEEQVLKVVKQLQKQVDVLKAFHFKG